MSSLVLLQQCSSTRKIIQKYKNIIFLFRLLFVKFQSGKQKIAIENCRTQEPPENICISFFWKVTTVQLVFPMDCPKQYSKAIYKLQPSHYFYYFKESNICHFFNFIIKLIRKTMHLLTDKGNTCGIKYHNKMNFPNTLIKMLFRLSSNFSALQSSICG